MLKKVLDPLASNINDSLTRATVLLPFTWMEWFCKKLIFWPMKTLRVRQYSLKKQTQFTMLNKVLDSLSSNINDSLTRVQCFFHSLDCYDLEQRWCFSPMKILRSRQYFFKKLTQFTVLNKVLDPLASNINDSLPRATVLLPFTWMGGYSKKVMFSPMKTLRGRQYSFQKLTQYTMLNKVLDPLASNINDLLRKGTVFLHSLQRGYFAQS
jgi:hypothetical protein